tara:strand:+ start:299 stop:988 length:690 start_codon:yes stop_codon:yes gene_type:complete
MKQEKFIELLNFYLDHEISLADATRLEEEIQRSPERRKMYREYCQMQKGCSLLAEEFFDVDQTEPVFAEETACAKRGFGGWHAGVGALAAACVALVVVLQSNQSPEIVETATIAESSPETVVASAPTADTTSSRLAMPVFPANNTKLQSVFTPKLINSPATAESARAFFARETEAGFDWMEDVQLDPIESDPSEMVFSVEPALKQVPRTYRGRRSFEGQVEMTAFQFQR